MLLYSAALQATFGRRPWRLAGCLVGSFVIGVVVAMQLRDFLPHLSQAQNEPRLSFPYAAWTVQALSTMALLGCLGHLGVGSAARTPGMQRLVLHWPVNPLQQWLCIQLPGLVALGGVLLLLLPSLLVGHLTAQPLLACGSAILGGFTALGSLELPARLSRWWALVTSPLLLGAEYWLICIAGPGHPVVWRVMAYGGSLTFSVFLLFRLAGVVRRARLRLIRSRQYGAVPGWPPKYWGAATIFRSHHLRLSGGCAVGLSLLAGAASWRWPLLTDAIVAWALPLITAALATDIRSIARKHRPAEIAAVRGSPAYLRTMAPAIGIALVGCTLPLWLTAWIRGVPPASILLGLAFGGVIGLSCSLWLAPQPRDVSAQIIANLLCVALIVGLPQLWFAGQNAGTISATASLTQHPYELCTLGITCLVLAVLTEYHRNPFFWSTVCLQHLFNTLRKEL